MLFRQLLCPMNPITTMSAPAAHARPAIGVRALLAACWLLAAAGSARAHDTWVLPSSFQLSPGQTVRTRVSSGDGLTPITAPPRRSLSSLHLIDSQGRTEAQRWQREATVAQAQFRAAAPGVACLALSMDDTEIALAPDVVAQYLREVHAPAPVLQAWQRQRALGQAWVERYAKDAKTYLRSGPLSTGWPALARIGHRLELVPLRDPTRLAVGDSLPVRLLLDGQPVPQAALRLSQPGAAEPEVHTEAQGQADIR
ncbi:MAG: hypothetical protein CFE45_11025, partial [Burkholderiales bacterium PBB5]